MKRLPGNLKSLTWIYYEFFLKRHYNEEEILNEGKLEWNMTFPRTVNYFYNT